MEPALRRNLSRLIRACLSLVLASAVHASHASAADEASPLARMTGAVVGVAGADAGIAARTRAGFAGRWRAGVDSVVVEPLAPWHEWRRYRVRQLWNGLPVLEREALVVVDARGSVRSALGRLTPGIAPGDGFASAAGMAAPGALDATAAGLRALEVAHADARVTHVAATRAVLPDAARARIVWAVELGAPTDGDMRRVLVDDADGANGRILRDEPLSAHAVGRVYGADPRSGLLDVTLPDLLGDGSRLRSDQFAVSPAGSAPVVRADGDFRFTPTSPDTTPFDQVNAYYQVDRFLHGFLAPLGYPGPPDSIVVRVQSDLYPGIAQTVQQYVSLGMPIPGYSGDPAKGQDVICHEVQHAVTYGFGVQPTGTNREAGALHEAISDYMAAAWTGDPAIGEWVYQLFPNGVTRVDQPASVFRYSNYDHVAFGGVAMGSAWANGMILSSALWQLRGLVGASADSLVLEALAYLPREPVWSEFADAMLLADRDSHASAHRAAILTAFRAHEILGSSVATIAGTDTLTRGRPATWRVQVVSTGGSPRWEVQHYLDGAPTGLPETVGFGDSLTYSDTHDFALHVTTAGAWMDSVTASLFVSVETPTIAIQGPTLTARGAAVTYHAVTTGAGPLSVAWWSVRHAAPGITELLGFGDSVTVLPDTAFQMDARATDGLGRSARTSLEVNWFTLRAHWPSVVHAGDAALATADAGGVATPPDVLWYRREWSDGLRVGDWVAAGAGAQYPFTAQHDFELRCDAGYSGGPQLSAQGFVSVDLPEVTIVGPVFSPDSPVSLEFFATWKGLPTQTVTWYVRSMARDSLERPVGEGPGVIVTEPPPYALRVQIVDRVGRVAGRGALVNAEHVVTIPGEPTPLRLDVLGSGSGTPALVFSLPVLSDVRVALYDVAGREVALLTSGRMVAGTRGLTLPAGMPRGLYFARLTWQGPSLTRRVVLLH